MARKKSALFDWQEQPVKLHREQFADQKNVIVQ